MLIDITRDFISMFVPLLTSLFVYAIGYIGMFKTEIFVQPNIAENLSQAKELAIGLDEIKTPVKANEQKYRKSGLADDKAEEYLQKLNI